MGTDLQGRHRQPQVVAGNPVGNHEEYCRIRRPMTIGGAQFGTPTARGALCLYNFCMLEGGREIPAAEPAGTGRTGALLDPVVVQGLRTLSNLVNHDNNLTGAMDEDDAVAVLRTLHDGGYALPAELVHAWALANGWSQSGAVRLSKLARKIDTGTRPRLNGLWPLREGILDTWRSEASQNDG